MRRIAPFLVFLAALPLVGCASSRLATQSEREAIKAALISYAHPTEGAMFELELGAREHVRVKGDRAWARYSCFRSDIQMCLNPLKAELVKKEEAWTVVSKKLDGPWWRRLCWYLKENTIGLK